MRNKARDKTARPKASQRGPSQRQLRAGELGRRGLAEIIARGTIQDADLLERPVTISEVRMSPDMRHATCYVAPLGGSLVGGDTDKIVTALTRVKSYLRGQLAHEVTRSEEHTSELQSLMRISYAVFCLKKKKQSTYISSK